MLVETIVAGSNCKLLIWETHKSLRRMLLKEKQIERRVNRAKTDKLFRQWLIKRFDARLDYYLERERGDQIANDNPIDPELFYIYLLFHANYENQGMFSELIIETEKLLNRTFVWRESNSPKSKDKK